MSDYDGRISEDCQDGCQAGTCIKTWSDPYGCGSCCSCLGGCYEAWCDNRLEDNGYVRVDRCTCNAPLVGPGSGHESDCGWVEADPDPVETTPWVDIDPDYEQYPEVMG